MSGATRERWIFAAMVTALLVAHVFAPRAEPGAFEGFLGLEAVPFDFGYHLAWMLLSTGAVWYLTQRLWRGRE